MKIDFNIETEYGNYSDCLIFPDDQPLPSEEVIESMKQQRLNNWFNTISNAKYHGPTIDPIDGTKIPTY